MHCPTMATSAWSAEGVAYAARLKWRVSVTAAATAQGLTLVHFSAQLKPCLNKKTPYTP
jgi:hypothetical protein